MREWWNRLRIILPNVKAYKRLLLHPLAIGIRIIVIQLLLIVILGKTDQMTPVELIAGVMVMVEIVIELEAKFAEKNEIVEKIV